MLKINFSHRDAQLVMADPLILECCLFLDPPWGGPNWDRENMNLTTWLGGSTQAYNAIQNARAVLLKLPRTFDLSSLAETGRDWEFNLGVESLDDHPADRVRILTAFSAKT